MKARSCMRKLRFDHVGKHWVQNTENPEEDVNLECHQILHPKSSKGLLSCLTRLYLNHSRKLARDEPKLCVNIVNSLINTQGLFPISFTLYWCRGKVDHSWKMLIWNDQKTTKLKSRLQHIDFEFEFSMKRTIRTADQPWYHGLILNIDVCRVFLLGALNMCTVALCSSDFILEYAHLEAKFPRWIFLEALWRIFLLGVNRETPGFLKYHVSKCCQQGTFRYLMLSECRVLRNFLVGGD